MASINRATKEVVCKIVYYGPGMSGKTTNLQLIHRGLPDTNRGQLVSLATHQERTLFFDFLPVDLGAIEGFTTKFQLYTVPGQIYYNATRKLVLRGVDGVVFVADSQPDKMDENIESLNNLRENMAEYGYNLEVVPHILQFNKQDLPQALSPADMNKVLNPDGKIRTLPAVAREGKGVKDALKLVASAVLDRLRMQISQIAADSAMATPASRAAVAGSSGNGNGSEAATATATIPRALPSRAPARTRLIDPDLVRERRPQLRRRQVEPQLPDWTLDQPVTVWWGNVRVGKGHLKMDRRQNHDGEGAYLVMANYRVFGLVGKSMSQPMSPTDLPQEGHPCQLRLRAGGFPEVTVETSVHPRVWLRMPRLQLIPPGKLPRNWPSTSNSVAQPEATHSSEE